MRSIKKIHHPEYAPINDLLTWRVIPAGEVNMLDPFIFLNHHGPQVYSPNNNGLPFGPHPHRGIETVTFIIEGDILHKDNSGHQSVIKAGGVQWMRAGKGLIHSEVSSDEFKKNGGPLEILQLWVNIPAAHKMSEPFYGGLQHDEIPTVKSEDQKISVQVISGEWEGKKGAFEAVCNATVTCVYLKETGIMTFRIPADHTLLFYVVSGKVNINSKETGRLSLVEFGEGEENISILADADSVIILGHAKPLNEPVAFGGPFVMSTEEEIREAYQDFQNGKFGEWPED
jgi:quercetin 2,3-dioxygenase